MDNQTKIPVSAWVAGITGSIVVLILIGIVNHIQKDHLNPFDKLTQPQTNQSGSLATYTSPDQKFSIMLPSNPKVTTKNQNNSTITTYSGLVGSNFYVVYKIVLPANASQMNQADLLSQVQSRIGQSLSGYSQISSSTNQMIYKSTTKDYYLNFKSQLSANTVYLLGEGSSTQTPTDFDQFTGSFALK